MIQIISDSVGYGFVVRGDGPTYVQTIDPTGPAAAAGLKVLVTIYFLCCIFKKKQISVDALLISSKMTICL